MIHLVTPDRTRLVVLTTLTVTIFTMLATAAFAFHYVTYRTAQTYGEVGPVDHFSTYAASPGDKYTADGLKHFLGQQLRYEEHYNFAWHTEGTTIGVKQTSTKVLHYHLYKVAGTPSTCHTAKFSDDFYFGSQVYQGKYETPEFQVCP